MHGRSCGSAEMKISGVRKKSEWIEEELIGSGEVYKSS